MRTIETTEPRVARNPWVVATAVLMAAAMAVTFLIAGVAYAATTTVKASGEKWLPTHAYIGKGDTIRWTNPTNAKHNIRSYGKNWTYSRSLDPGEVRRRTFNGVGTFKYRCTYHSAIVDGKCQGQCGWVHVFS